MPNNSKTKIELTREVEELKQEVLLLKASLESNNNSSDGNNLNYSESFEREVLQLSLHLSIVPNSEISSALDFALSRIGSFLSADRAYIFELDYGGKAMSNTHEWCNQGINPEIDNLKNIPCEILPMWMAALNRNENILIPAVEDLDDSWKEEKQILESQGIKSLVVIPIHIETVLVGFVGLDSVVKNRVYNSSEVIILKIWSNMLSGSISKQRSELSLDQIRQNYETFFNTINDFLFVLDEGGNIIHQNKTVTERLGYSPEELFGKSVLFVHPEQRRAEAGRIVMEMLQGISEFCPVPLIAKSGIQIPVETRVSTGIWDGKPVIFGVTKDISNIKLSEEKFSKLFYLNPSACGLTDMESREYIEVNDAFIKLFGFEKSEVIGNTVTGLGIMSPELISEVMAKADSDGNITCAQAKLKAKSGDIKYALLSAGNINVQDKKYRLTVVQDITERKIAEDALLESEKRLGAITSSMADWVWEIDENGIYTYFSPQGFELLGFSHEEIIGRTPFDLMPSDEAKRTSAIFREVLAKREPLLDLENWNIGKNGEKYCVVTNGVPILDEFGNLKGYRGVDKDITGRKKAEEERNRQAGLIEALLDSIPDIIFFKDVNGVYLGCNPPFAEFVGKPRNEIIGKTDYDLFDKEVADFFRFHDDIMLKEKRPRNNEEWITYPDGRKVLIDTLKTPYWRSDGYMIGVVGISRDITARKLAEQLLEKNKEEIKKNLEREKELNALKSQFISTVSHEFRTPLAVMLSSVQLLQLCYDKWDNEKREKVFDRIFDSIKYTKSMLDSISLIDREESGKITLKPSLFNLREILIDIADENKHVHGVNFNIDTKFKLSKSEYYFDKEIIRHIFGNVLSNAIKYSGNSRTVNFHVSENADEITFKIIDFGIGIPEKEKKSIFEPFQRASNVDNIQGTGFGLSIVKRFVEMHNGKVEIKSEVNKGTTVTIKLPLINTLEK